MKYMNNNKNIAINGTLLNAIDEAYAESVEIAKNFRGRERGFIYKSKDVEVKNKKEVGHKRKVNSMR